MRIHFFVLTVLSCTLSSLSAQLTINDTFGDLEECDTMTRGIYIVWWDKDYDYGDQVDVLLDTMISYRNLCLGELAMEDPPNPLDGYYYNVYIHSNGYFSTYNWGNGQGTDVDPLRLFGERKSPYPGNEQQNRTPHRLRDDPRRYGLRH